ncbi:MAG TPA: hypothetical protein VGK71_08780 [Nitrospirota bacterium]|jgi:quercetin dioxygenase-like cupin family protein
MEKSGLQIMEAVAADPKHYTVELENDRVRVIRVRLGPREKSPMHSHGDGVAVFLTNQRARFTFPDGHSEEMTANAGEAKWMPAFTHEPENLTDEPFELMLIEIKK